MTTKEAFEVLLKTKGIHNNIGITAQQLATIRFDYKSEKVSIEMMEELLTKAGWRKVPEIWVK